MTKEVSIRIKINDNFKDVTVDAGSLGKAIDEVTDSSNELSSSFVKFASIAQLAEGAAAAIGQLHGVFKDLTDAYADQLVAETQLAQAMSNMMGASDAEIQSIKDLCSEQQRLGVIGDEVQLAAAQELATYLEFPDSLRAIIPVMNDMAAQQYGLGASAESVTTIATMLGKVMEGQTEALSRYGYKFDEAQKRILQFGTESERAAVLVDVVSESVGGMNEALAQTPAGKMQQMSNIIGDWKEKLGKTAQSFMPVITGFNTLGQTAATVLRLNQAFKALNLETLKARVQSTGLAVAHRTQSAAARVLGISEMAAATATGALRVKIIALQATMTMGLSLAITAVIELITRLTGKSREASSAVDEVDEATEAFSDTSKSARSELAMYQVSLEDIIKHHKNDTQAVRELNSKYGESFGYHNTAAEWYNILTQKSEAYCRQLGYEAQARIYASQMAALQLEKEENDSAARNLAASGGAWRRGFFRNHMTKEAREIVANSKRIEGALAETQAKFDKCTQGMLAAQQDLRGGMDETSVSAGWQEMSLTQLTKAIQDQKGVVESLAGVDAKQAAAENRLLKQMEARKRLLEGSYGLGGESSGNKGELDGSKLIENATSYKELGNNIKYYQEQLERTHPGEVAAIADLNGKISALQAAQAEIKEMNALLSGDWDLEGLAKDIAEEVDKADRELSEYLKLSEENLEKVFKDVDQSLEAMALGIPKDLYVTLTTRVQGMEAARQQVESLKQMLSVATGEEREAIEAAIKYWSKYSVAQADASTKGEATSQAISSISSAMGQLSGAVGESAGDWLSWGSRVLSSIAQVIPQLVSLTTANIAVAATEAAASVASIPIVGWIMAGASALGLVATLASIPKFAEGGVTFSPTLGLFGEAGPEAVIPLERFPDLMADAFSAMGENGGDFRLVMRGDDLEYVMKRRMNRLKRG